MLEPELVAAFLLDRYALGYNIPQPPPTAGELLGVGATAAVFAHARGMRRQASLTQDPSNPDRGVANIRSRGAYSCKLKVGWLVLCGVRVDVVPFHACVRAHVCL